jgi:hypothetical protein
MQQIVFGLYLINTVLLILHEMDSAYWREWDLFGLPGGIGEFLLIHFPLYLAGLYGLVLVSQGSGAGMVFSFVIGAAGLLAFSLHQYFLRKGRPEFNTGSSKTILWLLLAVSALQIAATAAHLLSG